MNDTSPATNLGKTFDPAEIEARWYSHWEDNGLFRPDRPGAAPYTIVNPPPNVTGSLHIGHALDNTLQDIVIRYERLRGKDALWVVGTDHAGIATQMVVERQLEARQDKRTNYTREQFIDKVWEWKAESGGQITRQLRRLGCSMDWSREQFTMDPHFTHAVTKVFVDLYDQGLIYRDKRLVNWDPKLKTAISDLEVETQDVNGHFWHFRYPLEVGVTLPDGSDHIVVATTRPETMLADMAVAVHPDDPRYKAVIGKHVKLPITGRLVPIVGDEHADPELGSGAVKITPGHDFNDFEVGKRAGFKPAEMLNMFDAEANVVQTADGLIPASFVGLERFAARKAVVARMDELGLLKEVEDRVVATPFGDRGGVVIEPWLTDQWYVDAEKLAVAPMEAVRSGAIEIVPKSWEKTFFNWMENIQPWCVSRQLWWGHRIPAWYDANGNVYVAATQSAAQEQAGEGVVLEQDPDVLDTWFSSALWPFATLGWPDEDAPLLTKHYPNDLLISGFDILFFWDARMAMQGIHFMKDVPWKRLYLHGLVRAADGQKMSKSKGNVVDPLGLIDRYGADALRFFMAAMESQGRDVKMDEKRVEGYRNFATKLWNAARFCQSNGIGASTSIAAPEATLAVNKWIIGEVVETLAELGKAMADLRFDAAANAIYHFVWDTFCDWYLELIKPVLSTVEGAVLSAVTPAQAGVHPSGRPDGDMDSGLRRNDEVKETRAVAGWALDQILVMLHPFMPFITEELWNKLGERPYELIVAQWPEPEASLDYSAKAEIEWVIGLIQTIRSARGELNIPPSVILQLSIRMAVVTGIKDGYLQRNQQIIERLGRIKLGNAVLFPGDLERIQKESTFYSQMFEVGEDFKKGALTVLYEDFEAYAPLEGVIDIEAEKARLSKAMQASEKERDSLAKRLENPSFVEKAKPEAVDKARADFEHHKAEAERLAAALARLG